MKPDLTLLYSQMGLKPDCSLAELKLAYRRRISELQPDPLNAESQSPETSAMLLDLIWLYSTASRFHRRYGRLPGAAPRRRQAAIERPRDTAVQSTYADEPPRDAEEPRAPGVLGVSFLLLILVLGLLAWGEWLN